MSGISMVQAHQTRIKIANNSHIAGVPFRLLEELAYVDFLQASPKECARLLHEGEVDLALIPIFDLFIHGGYGTLEFGMGCRQRSGSMILYAKRPIAELKKIHVYSSSRTSLAILTILLKELWHCSPQIIRHDRHNILACISEFEGALMMHDIPPRTLPHFPICMDLATEWYRLTQTPSPFLVWATRPGSISAEQHAEVYNAIYRGIHIKSDLARLYAEEYGVDPEVATEFVGDHRRFYFDSYMTKGLEKFQELGAKHRLFPRTRFVTIRQTINRATNPSADTKRLVPEILGDIEQGSPLSIFDSLTLFHQALMPEIEVTLDGAPPLKQPLPRFEFTVLLLSPEGAPDTLTEELSQRRAALILFQQCSSERALNAAIERLGTLAKQASVYVSITDILLLANTLKVEALTVFLRLISLGITGCAEVEPLLLLKRSKLCRASSALDPQQWLDIAALLHGLGFQTLVALPTWRELDGDIEAYLLHLEKLRSLHFETHALKIGFSPLHPTTAEKESKLRLITKLFLRDVTCVELDVEKPLAISQIVHSETAEAFAAQQ